MNYLSSVVVMVGICVAIGGRSEAGTITKCKVAQQLSVKETHTRTPLGGLSDTTFRFLLTTGLEADTRRGQWIGPQYPHPRERSARTFQLVSTHRRSGLRDRGYVREVHDDGGVQRHEWKRSIKMRWDKGKLKLTAKVSASQKLNQPATVEWENVAKSKTKNTSPAETLVSLFADNFGIEFLSLQATVPTTIKTLNSIETKRNGTTKLASKQSIKGSKR